MPTITAPHAHPVIIITVYDRIQHIKTCLESLEAASGSENYHVIVGADAAAIDKHRSKIQEVHAFLKSKEENHKFKKITIIYNDINIGQLENIKQCHLLSKSFGFNSFIMMEDDVIVGNHFLDFMFNALQIYINNDEVVSVNGYLDPALSVPSTSPFLYNRFSAYGYASWYKKWDLVVEKRNIKNYAALTLSDMNLFKKQSMLTVNAKSYPFLAESFYRAGDIEIGLMMEVEGLWCLLPPVSLTANRGMDGSGLRSGINKKLQALEPSNEKTEVPDYKDIERYRVEDVAKRIPLRNITANWFSFIVYKYIPFGYEILKRLRTIKKSL